MSLVKIAILFSSISFLIYVISYSINPKMKAEFKRFGLEKLGLLTIVLQLAGATGLILGLWFNQLLMLASLGLGLLMFFGVLVRIKQKDSVWISIPALFFMILNFYIFWSSLS